MRKFQRRRKAKKKTKRAKGGGEQEFRVRIPREGEIFGLVEQLHGGKRMTVKCADGKRRMARIAGKLRSIWVREGDYVLLKPQMLEGDKKADITWRYRYVELDNLRRRGILKDF